MISKTRFMALCMGYFTLAIWVTIMASRTMAPLIEGSINLSFIIRSFFVPIPAGLVLSLAILPAAANFYQRRDFDFPAKAARITLWLAGVGFIIAYVMNVLATNYDHIQIILIAINVLTAVFAAGYLLRFMLARYLAAHFPDVDQNIYAVNLTARVVFLVLIAFNVLLIFMNGQHLLSRKAYLSSAAEHSQMAAAPLAAGLPADAARAAEALNGLAAKGAESGIEAMVLLAPDGAVLAPGGTDAKLAAKLGDLARTAKPYELDGWRLWSVVSAPDGRYLAVAADLKAVYGLIYQDLTRPLIILAVLGGLFAAIVWWLLRATLRPIIEVIAGLTSIGGEVTAHSAGLYESSQRQAEVASQQAASLEETSASLEELSSMTKLNADNAGQADQLTRGEMKLVESANTAMGQLSSSMKEITEVSRQTFGIIKSIDEIAFQTNLLALNAAVEAARAGEAGAGFAVVADEVRSLALRSAEAATSTTGLIQSTVESIENGSRLVEGTAQGFLELRDSAGKVSSLVEEIASASREQAQGLDQISEAMSQMDRATQDGAAQAQESAAAASQLKGRADEMQDWVAKLLSLTVGAGKAGAL